ncbi:MAG: hypothetical protein KC776_32470 [Myxococcales bacterium]|nr:hypothetical protein [Myxococcales bacterium]
MAGSGGTGGAPSSLSVMDLVSGGTVMTSSNYRLILTTGQGPGGNGVLKSTNYRLNGGFVGATN